MVNGIYEAAQNYLSKGWSVIPIKKGEKFPCISWEEYQNRLATSDELQQWFGDGSCNQIGIVTGVISGGLFILDFDGDDYQSLYEDFIKAFPEFDETVYVRTGGGRIHLYAKCLELPTYLTKLIKDYGQGNHIELRANEHQTLVPPSIHPSGNPYVFKGGYEEPIVLTKARLDEIVYWLRPPDSIGTSVKSTPDGTIVQEEKKQLSHLIMEGVPKGVRNDTIMREAARLIGKGLTRQEILPVLLTFNAEHFEPPLPEYEVETTLDSMLRKDARNPETRSILTVEGYNLISTEEVFKMTEVERQWLWKGILPAGGLSLIIAKPKIGKSTFTENLAVNVAMDKPFLGREVMQGKVIYLALEESLPEIKARLLTAFPEQPASLSTNLLWHFGMAPKEALVKLVDVLLVVKPVLVVVDIMQKFVRVKEGHYEEAISKLEPIMDTARKLNTHIALNHHAGKAEKELIDMVLGSTGYAGSVDTVIVIKGKPIRVMSTVQRYHEAGIPDVDGEVLLLGKDEFALTSGGSKELMDRVAAKEKILNVLGQIGPGNFYTEPLTYNQIAEAIGKTKAVVIDLMKELFDEEKVKRTGTGKAGRKGDAYKYSL